MACVACASVWFCGCSTVPDDDTSDDGTTTGQVDPPTQAACDPAQCDDGDPCNGTERCVDDACAAGTPLDCDDGNVCTRDMCNPVAGCIHTHVPGSCDDGNACTIDDTCAEGECVGERRTCDDDNPCTSDACDTASGCVFNNNTAECDDGDACTTDDRCADGDCDGTPVEDCVSCTIDEDCSPSDLCMVAQCVDGRCTEEPIDCDDGDDCTIDRCFPTEGCANDNIPGCEAPIHPFVPQPAQCSVDAECDDGSMCTSDTCFEGRCINTMADCNDGNACTADSCNPNEGCINVDISLNCDDGDPCTDDACDPAIGCTTTFNTAPCDDGDACTDGDTCADGVCRGNAVDCDDANPCTDDSCDPDTGCVHTNNTIACDDANACTDGDVCADGVCVPGTAVDCTDDNPCTDDTCDPDTGCASSNNNLACNDGSACTTADGCIAGTCQGVPVNCDDGNPCTTDSCDPVAGCVFLSNSDPCDDGDACTLDDTCIAGACVGGTALVCDDANVCTDDSCDAFAGCVYRDNTAPCDDGVFCNGDEACDAGSCLSSGSPCDPGNPNEVCSEALQVCQDTCPFDCNRNQVVDTSDFGYLQGCFGRVVTIDDPCACADYNDDGAVDAVDVALFNECLGSFCPCPDSGPQPFAAADVDIRVVLRRQPSRRPEADSLPKSLRRAAPGQVLAAEVWASATGGTLACVGADVHLDRGWIVDDAIGSPALPVLDTAEPVSRSAWTLGGCADPLDAPSSRWILVGTLLIRADDSGTSRITTRAAADDMMVPSIVGLPSRPSANFGWVGVEVGR